MASSIINQFGNPFYWYNDNYMKDYFCYCDDVFEGNQFHTKSFDEKGPRYGMTVDFNGLTPFNPETDMDRLEPKVAAKVKEVLEELAKKD